MLKHPRMTSEDFNNALGVIKELIQHPEYLDLASCQYNKQFKDEIKQGTLQIVALINTTKKEKEEEFTSGNILELAIKNLKDIVEDESATSASKLQAVKFLREAQKEMESKKEEDVLADKLIIISEFIKQFFTVLLDKNSTTDTKVITQQFLNRFKEIVDDTGTEPTK